MKSRNPQEAFWAGTFGDEYIKRNEEDRWLSLNVALFARILPATRDVESVLELGANIGLNLRAIRLLKPAVRLAAVEINGEAIERLAALGLDKIHHGSLLSFRPDEVYDLVFTKGVLIHVAPDDLPTAYDALYRSSRRYVMVMEYYNPSPVELSYRGHDGRLFKRDFAGELLDRFPDLKLLDYGFAYHRDPNFPLDDITWFLLERVGDGPAMPAPDS